MRDGTTRRRRTHTQNATWVPSGIRVALWRRHSRVPALRQLAEDVDGLTWSRRLLDVLLEELHVSDDFDMLAGRVAGLPATQYPRLIAIALLARHSWSPADLAQTAAQLGLTCPNLSAPEHLNAKTLTSRDGGYRRRLPRGVRPSGPRTR